MGIWKIDNVSSEEWHRRQMRRDSIKKWLILLLQLALMAGAALVAAWIAEQVHP